MTSDGETPDDETPDDDEKSETGLAKTETTALDFKTDVGNDAAKLISRVKKDWIDPLVLYSREESAKSEKAFEKELVFADKELTRQHKQAQLKSWFTGLTLLLLVGGALYLFAIGKSIEGMALLTFVTAGGGGVAWGRLQERLRVAETKKPPDDE